MTQQFSNIVRPNIRVSLPISRLQGLFGTEMTPTPLGEDELSVLASGIKTRHHTRWPSQNPNSPKRPRHSSKVNKRTYTNYTYKTVKFASLVKKFQPDPSTFTCFPSSEVVCNSTFQEQCSDKEYRRRLRMIELDVTPYHPTYLVCDRDPRGWPRYTTCDGSSHEIVVNGKEDDRREQLRRLVTNPMSQNLLFVNAVVRGGKCYEFAVATSTTYFEVNGGLPYNILTRETDQEPNNAKYYSGCPVIPRDIVRFVVNNTKPPVTIVSCDFDQLLTTINRSFFDDFCRFKKVSTEMLSETNGEELCKVCFPVEHRRGDLITSDGMFLYCLNHARTMMQYGADLLLYRPTTVSVCINDTRLWLSVVERAACGEDSLPLTYFELPRTNVSCRVLVFDDGDLLVRAVQDWKMPLKGHNGSSPVNTIKAMQYICGRLLAKEKLCPRSENMGPPSVAKVHRE